MIAFKPKSERLRQLQLIGVLGRQLPDAWKDITEEQWLAATAHEVIPWMHDDEAEDFRLEGEIT